MTEAIFRTTAGDGTLVTRCDTVHHSRHSNIESNLNARRAVGAGQTSQRLWSVRHQGRWKRPRSEVEMRHYRASGPKVIVLHGGRGAPGSVAELALLLAAQLTA